MEYTTTANGPVSKCAVVGVGGEIAPLRKQRKCAYMRNGVWVVCGEGRWGGTASVVLAAAAASY